MIGTGYSGTDFYCDVAIPNAHELQTVHDDEQVLAYHHTRPYWDVHIVVVPKRHIDSLTTALLPTRIRCGRCSPSCSRWRARWSGSTAQPRCSPTSVPIRTPSICTSTCIAVPCAIGRADATHVIG